MSLRRLAPPEATIIAGEAIAPAGQEAVASTFRPVADDPSIDARARETEAKMTDDDCVAMFDLALSANGSRSAGAIEADRTDLPLLTEP